MSAILESVPFKIRIEKNIEDSSDTFLDIALKSIYKKGKIISSRLFNVKAGLEYFEASISFYILSEEKQEDIVTEFRNKRILLHFLEPKKFNNAIIRWYKWLGSDKEIQPYLYQEDNYIVLYDSRENIGYMLINNIFIDPRLSVYD